MSDYEMIFFQDLRLQQLTSHACGLQTFFSIATHRAQNTPKSQYALQKKVNFYATLSKFLTSSNVNVKNLQQL